jgi:hypothetical protein
MSSPYRKRTGVSTPYLTRQIDVEHSYEQVAQDLGISVARVGQLEFNALDRMRRCFALIDEGMPVDAAVAACKGQGWAPEEGAMRHADPNREQFARVYPRPPRIKTKGAEEQGKARARADDR